MEDSSKFCTLLTLPFYGMSFIKNLPSIEEVHVLQLESAALPSGHKPLYHPCHFTFTTIQILFDLKVQNLEKSPANFWLELHRTKVRRRFRKNFWPSQNIWTLCMYLLLYTYRAFGWCLHAKQRTGFTTCYAMTKGKFPYLCNAGSKLRRNYGAMSYA